MDGTGEQSKYFFLIFFFSFLPSSSPPPPAFFFFAWCFCFIGFFFFACGVPPHISWFSAWWSVKSGCSVCTEHLTFLGSWMLFSRCCSSCKYWRFFCDFWRSVPPNIGIMQISMVKKKMTWRITVRILREKWPENRGEKMLLRRQLAEPKLPWEKKLSKKSCGGHFYFVLWMFVFNLKKKRNV